MNSKKHIISLLKEYFAPRTDISMAFLFGSTLSEKRSPDTDVDVAVYFDKHHSQETVSQTWGELEDRLNCNIDLIILNDSSPTVAWTAISGEKLLIRNELFYLEYMLKTSSEAEDFCDYIADLWQWRNKIRKAA